MPSPGRKQTESAYSMYGDTIRFSITKKEVDSILEKEEYYPLEIKNRVRDIIFHQMDKYAYLFYHLPCVSKIT